ncbi:MAG: Gfo/Idh/MocA family oxidoreductase, partial [Clostridia bacterium]|nr:Gfo/Idh/MocA family oxidoreductase [Clostridia bacterium]
RNLSLELYKGCEVLSDYTELFDKKDVDVVVNASYSEDHYPITKDLLEHGFNVMVEKPFGRNVYECADLIKTAKDNGVKLAVFQQSFFAPFYKHAYDILKSGKIGDVKQVNIRYNGLSRRWDWQTLLKRVAGSTFNTGPHPIGMGLGFLDFDKNTRVIYTKLDNCLTSGDADDYSKILFTAPNKPLIDIEIHSIDAYSTYNLKIMGTKGTFMCNVGSWYKMKYIVDGENPERPVIEEFLKDENGNPMYCEEKLITHEEEGVYEGSAFDIGTQKLYEDLYKYLTGEKDSLYVTPEHAMAVISVIEQAHAQNPLERKF